MTILPGMLDRNRHRLEAPANRSRPVRSPVMTVHERPFGRYFEDFEPGDVYKHWPGKTITEYDDHLFCMSACAKQTTGRRPSSRL